MSGWWRVRRQVIREMPFNLKTEGHRGVPLCPPPVHVAQCMWLWFSLMQGLVMTERQALTNQHR